MSTVGKTITCKAGVVWEFKKPISIETVELSPPKFGEVRVKMVAVGLCHSDLYILDGNHPIQPLPLVIGHEGAGIVESIGEGVTTVQPGDKVFSLFLPNCRNCRACKSRRNNACEEMTRIPSDGLLGRTTGNDGTVRFTCKGQDVYHFVGSSSFAEYTVIPETSCVKINPNAPLEKTCILACGFSTGYGSSANCVDIQPGDSTIVWGMGGVGLATVLGCKHKGASKIIGVDVSTEKEAFARKMGCTDYVSLKDVKKPLVETLIEMTNGGADFTFACIGNIQAMEAAVEATGTGGTMVIVGVAPSEAFMKISPSFMLTSRKVVGSVIGEYKVRDDLPKLVDRYLAGNLPLDDFITHTYKFEQINDAVSLMRQGKSIRSVIIM